MYHFQSLGRNVDICGTPVIKFRDYEFSTDDPVVAERIRRNSCFGREYWEDGIKFDVNGVEIPQAVETPRRKPGRPPKTQVVSGARTVSELKGE